MDSVSWLVPISARVFVTTRWTVITACRQADEMRAGAALAELCQTYWLPVYSCVRHRGYSANDAEDLTQDFFLHLLKGARLDHLDEAKGRFRVYLSASLHNFLRTRWRRAWTLRRGRGCSLIPIEAAEAEANYALALATRVTPEILYERQWARVVIDQTLKQLKIEMEAAGKEALFGYFDAVLGSETRDFPYREIARTVGLNVNALHRALHRWRQRYHTLLREEISRTVVSKAEIEDELRHLQFVFAQAE